MIELFEKDLHQDHPRSSKGNQLKFEAGGFWYKADYLGYEGLSEYTISKLLGFSSLHPSEYVEYETEQIRWNTHLFNGCKSRDFTEGWQLITLERLLTQVFGKGLNQIVFAIEDHTDRLRTMVRMVEEVTGIQHFGPYMARLLTVDTLFLNEDRHAHNLAVLTKNLNQFRLCPIFDNGAGLLSDTALDYPMDTDPVEMITQARPKTFCESFDEQIEIAEQLYGVQIHFRFDYNDIKAIVDRAELYAPEIRRRVVDIVMQRRKKFSYLFRK